MISARTIKIWTHHLRLATSTWNSQSHTPWKLVTEKEKKSANFFPAHTRTCVAYSCSASTSFRPTAYMQHNFTCLPDTRFQVWPDHKIETLPVKIALRRSITQLVYVVDNLLTNWLFSYRFSVRMTNDGAKGKRNKRS